MQLPTQYRRYIIIAIAGLAVLAAVLATFLPVFRVSDIAVTGTLKLNPEDVISAAGVAEGDFFLTVNTNKIEDALARMPYVAQAYAVKVFPGRVSVHITERRVSGYVHDAGNYVFIDADGFVLDVQNEPDEKLPIIEGLKYTSFTKGEILQVDRPSAFGTVVFLANLLQAYDLQYTVYRVDIKDEADIRLYAYNIEIRLGSILDANDKVRYLKEVLPLIPDINTVNGTLDLSTGFKGEAARFKLWQ